MTKRSKEQGKGAGSRRAGAGKERLQEQGDGIYKYNRPWVHHSSLLEHSSSQMDPDAGLADDMF